MYSIFELSKIIARQIVLYTSAENAPGRSQRFSRRPPVIQKAYQISDDFTADDLISSLLTDTACQSAHDKALLIYEPSNDASALHEFLQKIHSSLPDLKLFGMTLLGPLTPDMPTAKNTICSLLLFDSSEVRIHVMDCTSQDAEDAAAMFTMEAHHEQDLKGIMVFISGFTIHPETFLEDVSAGFPEVPMIGAQAGSKNPMTDVPLVIAGTETYENAIVAITFSGRDLHMKTICNVGWNPLGKLHEITETADDGRILRIDYHPATELYTRYLGVRLNDNFRLQCASFPLIEKIGDTSAPRLLYGYGKDGSIIPSVTMKKGTKISLSYTKDVYLLRDSLRCANTLSRFGAQGIFLISCLNRLMFLGEQKARRELSYFRQLSDHYSLGYGLSEILRTGKSGGIMNSTMVAVGMRECSFDEKNAMTCHDPELEKYDDELKPGTDCLVTFFEETTKDLNEIIDELHTAVITDELTGIANRRMLDSHLSWLLHSRSLPLSIMMFDIDHFKEVNDTYGHKTGDAVLCDIAALVKTEIRSSDLFARWGGDEFICVFEKTSLAECLPIANRICTDIRRHHFEEVNNISVSIGVASAHERDTLDDLFSRLDRYLYQAKKEGRDRIAAEKSAGSSM